MSLKISYIIDAFLTLTLTSDVIALEGCIFEKDYKPPPRLLSWAMSIRPVCHKQHKNMIIHNMPPMTFIVREVSSTHPPPLFFKCLLQVGHGFASMR